MWNTNTIHQRKPEHANDPGPLSARSGNDRAPPLRPGRFLFMAFGLGILLAGAGSAMAAGGPAIAPSGTWLPTPPWGGTLFITSAALAPPGLILYRRIERAAVLERHTRRMFYDAVRENPGLTIGEIGQRLSISYKTGAHHARVLVDCGLLDLRRDGRFLRAYATGEVTRAERRVLEGAAGEISRRVFALLARDPTISPRAVAERIGANRSTVYWHVRQLEGKGLVGKDDNGDWSVGDEERDVVTRLEERLNR